MNNKNQTIKENSVESVHINDKLQKCDFNEMKLPEKVYTAEIYTLQFSRRISKKLFIYIHGIKKDFEAFEAVYKYVMDNYKDSQKYEVVITEGVF